MNFDYRIIFKLKKKTVIDNILICYTTKKKVYFCIKLFPNDV